MVFSNDNESKEGVEDIMDQRIEEEVKSETDDEVEEDSTPRPRATIASIGVTANPFNHVKNLNMGGEASRHAFAPKTLASNSSNPFHTLIHKYQFERVPEMELPTCWDIDRSNNAGKESPKSSEKWGNNSKSWDSPSDQFMNRIEHNSEMIRILTYKIYELKDLVEKLIRASPPRDQA
jgi:hypothetical protein